MASDLRDDHNLRFGALLIASNQILIVEDSPEYSAIISRTLGDHGLSQCTSAGEASTLIKNKNFDLFIIDINLPDRDGFTLLSEIRTSPETASVPVLMLTGRKEITDKVTAFSLGADDYLTKPFDPLELRARVESKLKKVAQKRNESAITIVGDIEIDHNRHQVSIVQNGKKTEIQVTQTEFKILFCLARRPEQVYSRDQLLVAAWGDGAKVLDRVVDVHVCLLRKKLGELSYYIKSVPGVGYRLSVAGKVKRVSA